MKKCPQCNKEYKPKPKKKRTYGQWKKLVQKWFNEYIRLRDTGNPCISCGQHTDHPVASHYGDVRFYDHMRYDEDNVHLGCSGCNTYKNGNIIAYRKALIKKIGEKKVLELEERILSPDRHKFKVKELEELLEVYKNKVKDIKNIKNINFKK